MGDLRAKGFAPGDYLCRCHLCEKTFEGDKRAITCEDCARAAASKPPTMAEPLSAEEAVARWLDPSAFETYPNGRMLGQLIWPEDRRGRARVQAREILALPQLAERERVLVEALTDKQVEAMCAAHHLANCPPHETPAGGFTRWATWEEVCEMDGERLRRIASMRAALAALPAPPPAEVEEPR